MKTDYRNQRIDNREQKTEDRWSVLRPPSSVLCITLLCCITTLGVEINIDEHQLWKEIVSPLDQHLANNKADELKQMIELINSIQFEQPAASHVEPPAVSILEPPAVSTIETQQPATLEDERQKTEVYPPRRDRGQKTESQPPSDIVVVSGVKNGKSMSSQTLQKVEEMLKDPNTIANPLELAEVLFRSGLAGPAGLCYKRALVSIGADDPNMANERAWILFQIGNCLQDDDPNASKESYADLIRTHPDSPWAEIAKSRHALIEWNQQDQPRKLIEELK